MDRVYYAFLSPPPKEHPLWITAFFVGWFAVMVGFGAMYMITQ